MSPVHQIPFRFFHLAFIFCILIFDTARAETLSPKTLELVSQAVFEVVVSRPTRDSLEYKDPLPLHEIPMTIRNDKYIPLGTAFAIAPQLFVSAAHVMSLGTETQYGTPLLRDQKGSVFEVDQIVKLSERKDFVVFTIKGAQPVKPFEANTSPHLNQAVFAVGNALGEGVVIRDGLYTSATQEPIEGAWKWLRFSAAASPGNSGGPLLDADGRVLGLVLRKSPSENLNIALPIAEVLNAPKNLAQMFRTMSYMLPVATRYRGSSTGKLLALPRTYQDLNRDMIEYVNVFGLRLQDMYFSDMQGRLFPNGTGSKPLLYSPPWSRFPQLFTMNDDGYWRPEEAATKSADLGNNGTLEFGNMGKTFFFALHKPDNVTLDQLYLDDRFYMDLVLKGIRISRYVGQTPVRITSFGPAQENYTFRDHYSRIWLVRTWLREFDDTKVVTFSLPTPEGLVSLMRLAQTGVVDNDYLPEMKLMTNFVNVSYGGTVKEWRDFLQFRNVMPDALAGISLSEDNHSLSFRTPSLSLSLGEEVIPISDLNQLFLPMGYGISGNRVSWGITGLYVVQKPSRKTFVALQRHLKPDESLNEEFQTSWKKLVSASFPFNHSSYSSDGLTRISEVIRNGSAELYSVLVSTEGSADQRTMSKILEKVVKGVTVAMPGRDADQALKPPEVVHLPYWEYSPLLRADHPSSVRYAMQGQLLAEKGHFEEASQALAKALELDPRCAEAYFQRGLLRQSQGEAEPARADYAKSLEYNPFYPHSYNNLGDLLYKAGKIDEAMVQFRKALDLDPKMKVARTNLAMSFAEKGQHQLALKEYDRIIEQDPNDADGYLNRGNHYRIMGDFVKARSDLDKAISIKKTPIYYFTRAYTFQQTKEYDKAVSDYTAALELDPRYSSAYLNRGSLYHDKALYDKAVADFSKTIELTPSNAMAYRKRGSAYVRSRRFQQALDDLDRALLLAPEDLNALFLRGVAHGENGNLNQSATDLNKAISLDPGNADLYTSRGITLFLQKNFAGALADFGRAISLNPLSAVTFQNRGNLYAAKKEEKLACADWRRACELGACSSLTSAQKHGQCR